MDLSSPESVNSTVTTLLATTTPTVLINNAGIAQAHTILETSDAFLEKLFRINVLSHFSLIRQMLPKMMARRKGHIVSLASMASYTGVASLADYCASKAAVLGMHESLVQELAHRYGDRGGHAVQASIVHPLWARTPLIGSWERELTLSRQPVLTAEDVARRVVAHVLAGRAGSVFIPEDKASIALMRFLPDWVAQAIRSSFHTATLTSPAPAPVPAAL